MTLLLLLAIPFFAGLLALGLSIGSSRWNGILPRLVTLLALVADLALALDLWIPSSRSRWIAQIDVKWIPEWGARFHLGADGLSLVLIILTISMGILSVLASWRAISPLEPDSRVGFYHLNLLWALAGIIGVFLSLDLFLFYLFWELMLIPMYFLIAIWGGKEKIRAAFKFFIFTQAGGLLMLLAILGLYFVHAKATGIATFDYARLTAFQVGGSTALWLMLGFFAAFVVKLPIVPLHTWLPDAYAQAPTGVAVILAGILAKTGGYGLIRFVLPLFPTAAHAIAPAAMALAVAGIVYSGVQAFGQRDLKRLIGYSSIGHLAFVLLGVFAGSELALQGAILQMICHAFSIAGLFILSGAIEERLQTRDLGEMGGLGSLAPRMTGSAIFLALSSLGLPGIGNFIGEFLTLIGTFQVHPIFAALATLGFVFSTIYSLWMVQTIFHGPERAPTDSESFSLFFDFSKRETALVTAIIAILLWIGMYPQPLLNTTEARMAEVHHVYR